MIKRWIDGQDATKEDWDRIEGILAARGWTSLNRNFTRIRVAEENGELKGFYVLQLYPHAEPLWVAPSTRGSGLAEDLADDMLEFLKDVGARGWMLVADNPMVAKMAEERGMTKLEAPVYVTR
jgi:hypothetical protein